MKTWKAPLFRKGELVRIKGTPIEGRVMAVDMTAKEYLLDIPEIPLQSEKQLEKVTIIGDGEI